MALSVTTETLYGGSSPPNDREAWRTEEPVRMHLLCDQLFALELHQVDVGDAIDGEDHEWFQQMTVGDRIATPTAGASVEDAGNV